MTWFSSLLRRFGLIKPEPLPDVITQRAYETGYGTGYWAGVLDGRRQMVEHIEQQLAARGKELPELELADVTKLRLIH